MQEKLDALVRTQAMQLFRQQGLHFTMQQVAEPLHISKKTIYTVYPSKEALLLDMVDHAFAEIHRCKQEILAGSGTLQEKLRAVIIAMPTEYAALDLRQMKELDEKYPVVAARVRSQLENGWEPTMALLEQAVAEGNCCHLHQLLQLRIQIFALCDCFCVGIYLHEVIDIVEIPF